MVKNKNKNKIKTKQKLNKTKQKQKLYLSSIQNKNSFKTTNIATGCKGWEDNTQIQSLFYRTFVADQGIKILAKSTILPPKF